MAISKVHTVQVAVPLDADNTRDWYPVKGKSSEALPDLLPHLMHADSYAELTLKVRKTIKAEAKKAGRELLYSVEVNVEAGNPTTAKRIPDVYLVATIRLK